MLNMRGKSFWRVGKCAVCFYNESFACANYATRKRARERLQMLRGVTSRARVFIEISFCAREQARTRARARSRRLPLRALIDVFAASATRMRPRLDYCRCLVGKRCARALVPLSQRLAAAARVSSQRRQLSAVAAIASQTSASGRFRARESANWPGSRRPPHSQLLHISGILGA